MLQLTKNKNYGNAPAMNTRKKGLLCLISALLCSAMLIGTTFAWFSDSANTGTNSVIAGNLKVGLNYWNGSSWADATADDVTIFDDVEQWEPGAVAYEEFQVQNLGNLAAKYSVYADIQDIILYCMADPNNGENPSYPAENYPYMITGKTLGDVLYVASYPGRFTDLVNAVNNALGLDGDEAYTADGGDKTREVVLKAVEEEILMPEPLYGQDIGEGSAWAEGGLLPKGKSQEDDWEFSYRNGDNVDSPTLTVKNPSDSAVFTLICWWAPENIRDDGTLDNDYNLVNGKVATIIPSDTVADELGLDAIAESEEWVYDKESWGYYADAESFANYISKGGLSMKFSITLFATQVEYEEDSFGNQYDKNVWPQNEFIPPYIED